MNDELDVLQIRRRARQIAAREFFLSFISNEDADDFSLSDFPHHFAIHPANGINFIWPIGLIVRPAEPGGFVFLPFCRHGETEFGGRGLLNILNSLVLKHKDARR